MHAHPSGAPVFATGARQVTNTPYLLGRLLATLEHLKAIEHPHRMYELASIEPVLLAAPLNRVTATGDERTHDILMPVVAELPPDAFSGTLNAEQQSAFGLGYYHQRAEFRAGLLPKLPEKEPDLDDRYELRMSTDLKAWTKANGGDKLIRALLRAARERHEA